METELRLRDYPIIAWLFGFGGIAFGTFYFLTNAAPARYNGFFSAGIGLLILIFMYALTITVDKQTGMLILDYRSIILHSVNEIPLSEIKSIRLDSSSSRSKNRSTTYRIEAVLKNGETIPFRSYYSSEFILKQRRVDALRKFIGLTEDFDESPIGLFRAVPKLGQQIAQAQQQALTGSNAEEHVTDGVHWQLQSIGIGAAPGTRWFSPDFKTRSGFLFLAQKVAGQSSSGFLASLSKTLFKQSIALYGFDASDTPNLAQADLYASLSPAVDTHFMAFSSASSEARQILNPWAQNPLANWGERHPLKQLQSSGPYSQIVVLFSPNGVYIACPGTLQPEQVDEVTKLGIELVKSQGV